MPNIFEALAGGFMGQDQLSSQGQLGAPTKGALSAQGDRVAQLLRSAAASKQPQISDQVSGLNRMGQAGGIRLANVLMGQPVTGTLSDTYDARVKDLTDTRSEGLTAQAGAEESVYNIMLKAREQGNEEIDRLLSLAEKIAGEDAAVLIDGLERDVQEEITPDNFIQYALPYAKEKDILKTGDYTRQKEQLTIDSLRGQIANSALNRQQTQAQMDRQAQNDALFQSVLQSMQGSAAATPPAPLTPTLPNGEIDALDMFEPDAAAGELPEVPMPNDGITGGAGNDMLTGGAGNDVLQSVDPEKLRMLSLATGDPRFEALAKMFEQQELAKAVPPELANSPEASKEYLKAFGKKTAEEKAAAPVRAEGARKFDVVLSKMEQELEKLNASDSVASPSKTWDENLGLFASNSMVGRQVQDAFGTERASSRQTIENLKPRLIAALAQATGQSSKSLDSNTELKLALDSLGSSTQTYEARKAALDNIREMFGGTKTPIATPNPAPSNVGGDGWGIRRTN